MSNKTNSTKEQIEVANTEVNTTDVATTEEVKGSKLKELKAKAGEGFKKHKKLIIGVSAAVGVAIGAGLLGADYGKKNKLQDNHQEYIEGEFTEEDSNPTEVEATETEEPVEEVTAEVEV